MKRLLVGLFLTLIALIAPANANAQGSYTCQVNAGACTLLQNNCAPNFQPDCANRPLPQCEVTSFTCIPQTATPLPTNDPRCTAIPGQPYSGINTAIGCIPFSTGDSSSSQTAFTSFFLRWGFGIGGGIAFLLILYAGFMIMTSTGIPDRIKAGQELMTSAIAGLILLIFSVFVLELIGVDILRIPGFGQ